MSTMEKRCRRSCIRPVLTIVADDAPAMRSSFPDCQSAAYTFAAFSHSHHTSRRNPIPTHHTHIRTHIRTHIHTRIHTRIRIRIRTHIHDLPDPRRGPIHRTIRIMLPLVQPSVGALVPLEERLLVCVEELEQ